MATVAAKPSISLGAQLGFINTGIVADVNLGFLSISASANYALGFAWIVAVTGESLDDAINKHFVTFAADVHYPWQLSENFILKLGLSTTLITNFENYVGGVAGIGGKAEYWLPNDIGLFANVNFPIMLYGAVAATADEGSGGMVFFNALLPLLGIFTSSVGVAYRF